VLQTALARRFTVAVLALIALSVLFSAAITDSDFWWHLKTGQYIVSSHRLPNPDPFAFTTPTSPAEAMVRDVNLSHEWLAQTLLYLVYAAFGFAGVVVARVVLLLAFCAIAGLIVYWRGQGFQYALAAASAVGIAAYPFVADRPYLLTFVFVAGFVALLDIAPRKVRWILPPLMLIWANCHGGFVLGLAVVGVWVIAALFTRRDLSQLAAIWAVTTLAAAFNPNGLRVFEALLSYRRSFLTSTLAEWQPPSLWPPSTFSVFLVSAGAVLIYRRNRVRLTDVILFAVFAGLALLAGRNTFLIAFAAPVLVFTYLPVPLKRLRWSETGIYALAVSAIAATIAINGRYTPELRSADWAYPVEAAKFLREHQITGRMFNTYEYGGYLIWTLWPQQRVFIDGRALSESVFRDYGRILHFADGASGKSAIDLLDQYGIDVILMNNFEYTTGVVYALSPALAEATDSPWKLVYADRTAVVFLRRPPPNIPPIDPEQVFTSMQLECALHIEHEPQYPGCARALGLMYAAVGEPANARRWLALYLEHHTGSKDSEAEQAFAAQH
jgi:hypothetical protein